MIIKTRNERIQSVIDLYLQGKSYREIAEIERMSLRDIGPIIDNYTTQQQRQKEQQKIYSISSQAYNLFSKGKTITEVAIELQLRCPLANQLHMEYLQMQRMDKLIHLIQKYSYLDNNSIDTIFRIGELAARQNIGIEQLEKLLRISNNALPSVEAQLLAQTRTFQENEIRIEGQKYTLHYQSASINENLNVLNNLTIQIRKTIEEKEGLENTRYNIRNLIDSLKDEEGYKKIEGMVIETLKRILKDEKIEYLLFAIIDYLSDPDRHNEMMDKIIPSYGNDELCTDNNYHHNPNNSTNYNMRPFVKENICGNNNYWYPFNARLNKNKTKQDYQKWRRSNEEYLASVTIEIKKLADHFFKVFSKEVIKQLSYHFRSEYIEQK